MKYLELPCVVEHCQLPGRAAILTFCFIGWIQHSKIPSQQTDFKKGMQSPSFLYLTKPDVLDNIKPTDSGFGRKNLLSFDLPQYSQRFDMIR